MAYSYKGALTFGLVYVPVQLQLCVKEHDIGFNMLEKKTKSRVKYKKTCVDCDGKEVKNSDIVKGYQYEKDKYVIFTDADFEKIKTQKDKNITILQFVDIAEVDPIYFDKAYYVKPTGGESAFNVLLRAMEEEKKAAIAKTVLGTKETIILIRAKQGKMLATTLYFASEIQAAPAATKHKATKQELDLAKKVIEQMTEPFAPEKFKDEYYLKLKKAIKRKIAGNEIVEATNSEPVPSKVINLMDALKKSLETTPKKSKVAEK